MQTQRFEAITLSLPAHWLVPVLYGDLSPLDEAEAVAFDRWLADTIREVGHGKTPLIGHIEDAPYFARYHDAVEYGVPTCMCYDVELLCEA